MAERSIYADMKMAKLREKVAEHKLVNDKGLPLKATRKADLIAALEEHDRTGGRPVSPRRRVVAARAASPPRKGGVHKPSKIRSEAEQQLNYQLFRKVTDGELAAVNILIKEGANVNAADDGGETALIYAVRRGHREMVEMLIAAGADVNVADNGGGTALMNAAYEGYREIVERLIVAGADVNVANNKGWTALMWAALEGHREIVEMSIAAGANVDASTNNGWSALMGAARAGHREIMERLVAAGADVNAADNKGRTARDFYRGNKAEFDRIVEEFTPRRMVKAAQRSPSRSR